MQSVSSTGRKGQSRVFLPFIWLWAPVSGVAVSPLDSRFYLMCCWLLASSLSTSFNSPTQRVLRALSFVNLWFVSLSSDWLFSLQHLYLFCCMQCFPLNYRVWTRLLDRSQISIPFHLLLAENLPAEFELNKDKIMTVQK